MSKPRSSGQIRDRALAALLRALARPFSLLSWGAAQRAGACMGSAGWVLAGRDRRRTLEHLAIAFPERSAAERRRLARAAFRHWGTNLAEVLHLFHRRPESIRDHVTIEGWEHVEAAQAARRSILVLSAHCGNWELLSAFLPGRGLPVAAIARRLDDPALDRLLVDFRAHFGTRTIARGSREASRELRAIVRGAGALAVLIDQDTRVEGAWVPFFGRPAFTPIGAALLARRLDAAVLPILIARQPSGQHRARVEPALELPEDAVEATALMTARIEAQIRRHPEQWVWMHRRWRRQAPALLLALVASLALAIGGCRRTEPELAWHRTDLWSVAPQIEDRPPRVATPFEAMVSFLGLDEVRDMRQVPASQLQHFPRRTAGQVRALAQARGTRLAWRIALEQEPYFTFVPLGADCACDYRVAVRRGGAQEVELARLPAPPRTRTAAAVVELDLSQFAAQTVDLLLDVRRSIPAQPDPPGGGRALWGTPQVWSRRTEGAVPRPAGAGSPPNILLVGLDTLRADALGPRGDQPSLTPAWDALAAESEVWTHAYSTFNSTNPSFASILTGLYGKNHGVYDLATRLAPEHATLAELLRAGGYRTRAIVSASHLGDHNSGLGQGFETVATATEHHAAEMAVDLLLDWLEVPSERPFFAFLHLFDPHTPHTPPEPYALGERPTASRGLHIGAGWLPFRPVGAREFTEPVLGGQRDLYDGEVAYLDRQLDRLLDWLRSRGWLETTLVALVADHGENVGDHDIRFRHVGLWDSTTHVPMLLRRPGKAAGRVTHGLVQTIDLFPTLLAAAGLDARRDAVDGIALDELTGAGRNGRRAVFAEHAGGLGTMVRTAQWKLIRTSAGAPAPTGIALHDLAADPGEERNVAGNGHAEETQLVRLLEAWQQSRRPAPGAPTAVRLTPEELARLRALGYL